MKYLAKMQYCILPRHEEINSHSIFKKNTVTNIFREIRRFVPISCVNMNSVISVTNIKPKSK